MKEVWIQAQTVEAPDPDAAVLAVANGEGDIDESSFEYSHTLPTDDWGSEDAPD